VIQVDGEKVFSAINEAFAAMPIAALVEDKVRHTRTRERWGERHREETESE
jgi:hypothetical protein